ncbi:DUF1638 domain-containing protein [Desulfopila aestuarii]|uniref:DUF1638 domain-containing protein n=1 Tax=Desulfopila aestuarii DSM 18488 TaxID=1121416 RepID=A0A1M7Y677_9BACT|nr:DUF1638 domain-containing protein [Desulfopila aestuarii]SHO47920.1 Protein of unknown function [Desulfopila aestuarii DSM 18488]
MKPLTVICCSVLRREIEELLAKDYPEAELVFLDSMLHMHPEKMREAIDKEIADRPDRSCLLVYGDCHAHMRETAEGPHCAKVNGVNCGHLLLGTEEYRTCRNSKTFLFLPEWTERWHEVFEKELGFTDRDLAREFMKENQRKLLYLDTGLIPVPQDTLNNIAEFFDMPIGVLPVTLGQLRQAVKDAINRMAQGDTDES